MAMQISEILFFILKCIYLAVPGMFANMAPVLFKNSMKFLAAPVDFGKTWKGKPIFGKNKTFRGFVAGIFLAIIATLLQTYLYSKYPYFQSLSFIPYSEIDPFLLGFLMGFGVLFGDLAESFVKRRLGIPPGGRFFPWDQLDHLAGGLLFLSFVFIPPWEVVACLIALAVLLSVTIKHIGYWLGIEKSKW
ncbi:CDP-archaeol synthase [Candidatus Woesearchaeota archaeon]|nr:MAG: CDP-archaeol synthase [Candidatus Woesearchaeota archaeon]